MTINDFIINPRFIPANTDRVPQDCFMFETSKDLTEKSLSTHCVKPCDVDLFTIKYKDHNYGYIGRLENKELYYRIK